MPRRLNRVEKNLIGCLVLAGTVILFLVANIDRRDHELSMCYGLAPAVEVIIAQNERVRVDLLALESELLTLLTSPQQVTRADVVAMISTSAAIRAGL